MQHILERTISRTDTAPKPLQCLDFRQCCCSFSDIRAINIDDIAKTVEENAFIEEELKNALEALKEEEQDSENSSEEELTLENYNDILNNLDNNEDYVDAFDNIVYFDELGVDNDTELEELTEEIYPGIRKMKK